MRLFRPGFLVARFYPDAIVRIKTTSKVVYLTFDDSPNMVSTSRILDILKSHNVKATFFCNGREAEHFPQIMEQIRADGHITGNHAYSHIDGWGSGTKEYLSDVSRAAPFTSKTLFRPPFGHLRFRQYRKLKEKYNIVFWDLMPYDFDGSFGKGNSLRILKAKIRPGSIIVLHDSATSCVREILADFLTFAFREGYRFEPL